MRTPIVPPNDEILQALCQRRSHLRSRKILCTSQPVSSSRIAARADPALDAARASGSAHARYWRDAMPAGAGRYGSREMLCASPNWLRTRREGAVAMVLSYIRMTAEVKAALLYVDGPSSTPITCTRSPDSKRSRRQAVTSRWPAVSARRLWHTGSRGGL
jgi:hypothetical protein